MKNNNLKRIKLMITLVSIVMFLLGALAFWQHRTNIQRLLAGKERHTYLNHEKNQEEAERFKRLNS